MRWLKLQENLHLEVGKYQMNISTSICLKRSQAYCAKYEDIVTTGGQIIESVKEPRNRGAIIDTVLCVILRDEKAYEILAKEGLKLIPAFTMDYIKEQVK